MGDYMYLFTYLLKYYIGFSEILLDTNSSIGTDDQRHFLQIMGNAANHLSNLVNNVLVCLCMHLYVCACTHMLAYVYGIYAYVWYMCMCVTASSCNMCSSAFMFRLHTYIQIYIYIHVHINTYIHNIFT